MKINLVFLIILVSASLSAQNGAARVGLLLRPQMSFRFITVRPDFPAQILSDEVPIASYSAGTYAQIHLRRSGYLRVGINFSREGVKTKTKKLIFEMPEPSLPHAHRGEYYQFNLNLPVDVLARFEKGKRAFFFFSGLAQEYNLGNYQKLTYTFSDGTTTTQTSNLEQVNWRRFNVAARLGFGWDFAFRRKWGMTVGPDAQFSLLNQVRGSYVSRNVYSVGLSCGVFFR